MKRRALLPFLEDRGPEPEETPAAAPAPAFSMKDFYKQRKKRGDDKARLPEIGLRGNLPDLPTTRRGKGA